MEKSLRNKLVEQHLPLVMKLARKLCRRCKAASFDDLVQDGSIGLMQAAEKYDPSRGVLFRTFARRRISGAMLDAVRSNDWVPRLLRTRNKLAVKQGQPEEKFAYVCSLDGTPLNVPPSQQVKDDDTGSTALRLQDFVPDERTTPPDSRAEMSDEVHVALRGLNKIQRIVMLEYFILGKKMKDIGKGCGIHESRVSQILTSLTGGVRKRK